MTKYTFTKIVDSDRLWQEIQQSSITIALSSIVFTPPESVDIYFKTDLSTDEVTTLTGLITSHVPTPLDLYFHTNRDGYGHTDLYFHTNRDGYGYTVSLTSRTILPMMTKYCIEAQLLHRFSIGVMK